MNVHHNNIPLLQVIYSHKNNANTKINNLPFLSEDWLGALGIESTP